MTQDIGNKLLRIKRSIIEREIKMYVIAHHRYKSFNRLRKSKWTETWPIDQLVDEENNILKFETKEEALQTLKSWGVDIVFAQQEGVTIEGVN